MEVVRGVVLCCCCVVGLAATCEASGFFRRLPEVGEWARYELVMSAHIHSKAAGQGVAPQFAGSLTLRCVGEETIDDIRHLWIEGQMDLTEGGEEESTLLKVLVPADQLVDGEVQGHIVRGWCGENGADARALILDDDKFDQEPAAFALMHLFPDSRIAAGRRQARTVTVAGAEHELTHCELGDLPRHEIDHADMVGEAVWWPSADHAFGIAAAEMVWTVAMADDVNTTIIYTSQLSLSDTGRDAESELPEQN